MNHFHLAITDRVYRNTITMPLRGDGVPMHKHDADCAHTTKVLAGSILAYGPGKTWVKAIALGETYDFPADQQEHEIVALEDGTVILNTIKAQMPDGLAMDEAGTDLEPITVPL